VIGLPFIDIKLPLVEEFGDHLLKCHYYRPEIEIVLPRDTYRGLELAGIPRRLP
jgi:hypothetical protein